MFRSAVERPATRRAQADELPGAHAALPLAASTGATATCPCATRRPARSTATSSPARCTGLTRVRYVTQDDAHIFCTERADRRRARRLAWTYLRVPLRAVRHRAAGELSTRPDDKLGIGRGVGLHGGQADRWRSSGTGSSTSSARARASFYGPKIDLHANDSLGRSWQLGTIQLDAQMPPQFGLTYMGADNREHPVVRRPSRALRLVRAVHRHRDRALRRSVPDLAGARAGARAVPVADAASRRRPPSSSTRFGPAGVRAEVDERDETLGKRIRDAELAEGAVRRRLGRPRVARGDGRAEARGRGRDDDVARRPRRRRSAGSRPRGSPRDAVPQSSGWSQAPVRM